VTDEIEAIRARYEADPYDRSQAVADRATLLRLLDAAREKLAEERAKLAEIREALTFYAEKANYNDRPLGNDMWATAAAVFDGGKRARAALAKDALPTRAQGESS
jgi:hypothetical protein